MKRISPNISSSTRCDDALVYVNLKTAFDNVGDALINRQLIDIVSSKFTVKVNTSLAPRHFVKSTLLNPPIKAEAIQSGFLVLTTSMIFNRMCGKRVVFLLMPGGHRGEKSYTKYVINLIYNSYLWFINKIGVEIFQFGVSYENMGPKYISLMQRRSSLTKRLFVRDEISFNYAQSNNIAVDGIIPDLAYNIDFNIPKLISKTKNLSPRKIAISFRSGEGFLAASEVTNFVTSVVNCYPYSKFVFVTQVGADVDLMRKIYADVSAGDDRFSFADISTDLSLYRSVYNDCDIIFSNRLHALLLGMSCGARPNAILKNNCDTKIRGVFASVGMENRVFSTSDHLDDIMASSSEKISQASAELIISMQQSLRHYIIEAFED